MPEKSKNALLQRLRKRSNLGCGPLGGSDLWRSFELSSKSFFRSVIYLERIHRITDLSDLKTDHRINDPARSFG